MRKGVPCINAAPSKKKAKKKATKTKGKKSNGY